MSISTKKFSIAHIAAISLIVSLLTSSATLFFNQKSETLSEKPESATCHIKSKRIEGYQYIKPLLFVDEECESEEFASLKHQLNTLIDRYKSSGDVNSASIYLRDSGQWLSINEAEKYEPGSLFKVAIMITILKMNEDNPGFLDKKITYSQPIITDKKINFESNGIKLGQTYTVRELLKYMIQYSDNNATVLLETNMDMKTLQKLFSDLDLEAPNLQAMHYYFTARDYSIFMRAIYNAGYLTIKDSEYAATLLGKCEFKDGILKGLPDGTKVAHKFGETGNESERQLHESAIVYLENKPYLLTVMTKGKDFKKLSELLGEISNAVYSDMKQKAVNAS